MIQSWLAWNLFRNHWSKAFSFFADHVEITDMRVTVCRDAVSGKCLRNSCKFYHLPIVLPHPATLASSMTRWNQLPHSTNTHTHDTPYQKLKFYFLFSILNKKIMFVVTLPSSLQSRRNCWHTHILRIKPGTDSFCPFFIFSNIFHFFPVDDLWISFSLSLSLSLLYFPTTTTHTQS